MAKMPNPNPTQSAKIFMALYLNPIPYDHSGGPLTRDFPALQIRGDNLDVDESPPGRLVSGEPLLEPGLANCAGGWGRRGNLPRPPQAEQVDGHLKFETDPD
jgi:hypothetical protein